MLRRQGVRSICGRGVRQTMRSSYAGRALSGPMGKDNKSIINRGGTCTIQGIMVLLE